VGGVVIPGGIQHGAATGDNRRCHNRRMSLDDADHRLAQERRSRLAKLLAILIPIVLLIVFFLANARQIQIDFLVFTATTSLFWIILISSLLGGVVGFFIGRPGHLTFRRNRGNDAKENNLCEDRETS
jgi:uncharacterized integral membrane protein